jgi:hypothetical protein
VAGKCFDRVVALWWQLVTRGVSELERFAVGASEGIGERVESEVASEGKSGHNIGRSDECVCGGVSIITAGEVAIVRGDNLGQG